MEKINEKVPNTISNLYIEQIDKLIDNKSIIRLNQKGTNLKKTDVGIKMLLDFKLGIQKKLKEKILKNNDKGDLS